MNDEKFKAFCDGQEWYPHQNEETKMYAFRTDVCPHEVRFLEPGKTWLISPRRTNKITCTECEAIWGEHERTTGQGSDLQLIQSLVAETKALRARLDAQQRQIDELTEGKP